MGVKEVVKVGRFKEMVVDGVKAGSGWWSCDMWSENGGSSSGGWSVKVGRLWEAVM